MFSSNQRQIMLERLRTQVTPIVHYTANKLAQELAPHAAIDRTIYGEYSALPISLIWSKE